MSQESDRANQLIHFIQEGDDWLIDRILHYSKKQNYTQYTSTLREAWRMSISGLSELLIQALKTNEDVPELDPDEDLQNDPCTRFGIVEAQKHRTRGIELGMFLGLMKYYKQSYIDYVNEISSGLADRQWCIDFINRYFDRIEIGFCMEWAGESINSRLKELQDKNRNVTNEKNKYLTIFESLSPVVILYNAENKVENMNFSAGILLFGSKNPGKYYYNELKNDSIPWLEEDLIKFIESNQNETIFEKSYNTDRGEIYFEVIMKRLLDISEKYAGTTVILSDNTGRKSIEDALIKSEVKYRGLYESSKDGIVYIDMNGYFLEANKSFLKMTGYTLAQLQDKTFLDLTPARWQKQDDDILQNQVYQSGFSEEYEKEFIKKDGKRFFVNVMIWLLVEDNGEPEGMWMIVRDISGRKRLEKERLQRERLQGVLEMAGATCHEFNQPLQIISGYAELLESQTGSNEEVKTISQQVTRMSEITRKLQNITKYQTKKYLRKNIIDIDESSNLLK